LNKIVILLVSLFFGVVCFAQAEADMLFATGNNYLQLENYERAAVEFGKIVDSYPKYERIGITYFLLGETYRSLDNTEKALLNYRQVATKQLGEDAASIEIRARSHYSVATLSEKVGDYQNAERFYDYFLTLIPKILPELSVEDAVIWEKTADSARFLRAEVLYEKLNRLDDAIIAYNKVIETTKDDNVKYWSMYKIADTYLRKGDNPENNRQAVACLEQIPIESEAGFYAQYFAAHTLIYGNGSTVNDAVRAIPIIERVLSLENMNANIRTETKIMLAAAYIKTDQLNYAMLAYNNIFEDLDTKSAVTKERYNIILIQAGNLAYQLKDYRKAIKYYSELYVVGNKTENDTAKFWALNSYYKIAVQSSAVDDYKVAIDYGVEYAATLTVNDSRSAIVYEIIANCFEANYELGVTDNKEDAIRYYTYILNQYPKTESARNAKIGIDRLTRDMTAEELLHITEGVPDIGDNFDVKLNYSVKAFSEGDYDSAINATRDILSGETDQKLMIEASYILAASLQNSGRYANAIEVYRSVVNNFAGINEEIITLSLYGLCSSYINTSQYILAVPIARQLQNRLYSASENTNKIDEELTRKLYLAAALQGNRQYDNAEELYMDILASSQTSKQAESALLNMGYLQEIKNNYSLAEDYYNKFIQNFSNSQNVDIAFYRKGIIAFEAKDYNTAIDSLKRITFDSKYYKDALYNLAWSYKETNNTNQANNVYAAFIEKYPDDALSAEIYYQFGENMYDIDPAFAKECFIASLHLISFSNQAEAISYLIGVKFYDDFKDYSLASEAYEYYIANYRGYENYTPALFWSASSLENAGKDFDKAINRYRQYINTTIGSDSWALSLDAETNIGNILLKSRDYDGAIAQFNNAMKKCSSALNSNNEQLKTRANILTAKLYYQLGECYFALGDYNNAIDEYVRGTVTKYEPYYSLSQLKMAICSAELGDMKNATATLRLLAQTSEAEKSKGIELEGAKMINEVAKKYNIQL